MSQTAFHTDMGPRENLEDARHAVVIKDAPATSPRLAKASPMVLHTQMDT